MDALLIKYIFRFLEERKTRPVAVTSASASPFMTDLGLQAPKVESRLHLGHIVCGVAQARGMTSPAANCEPSESSLRTALL